MELALASGGLGLIVGSILALTGAGGAILAVPLLVFGLHLTMIQAVPSALFAVAVSAALGALIALRSGWLRYKAALVIGAVGIPFAPLGLWTAHRVPNTPLTILFAIVLGLVALRMFVQARRELSGRTENSTRPPPPCLMDPAAGRLHWTIPCARVLALSGAVAGFLSGLLGVGGGFVIVPALRRYTDLEMPSVVATSLAVMALVTAGGVATAALTGHVDWNIASPFAAGAIAGMLGGKAIANRIKGPRLQQAFAVTAGLIAIVMLFTTVFPSSDVR